MKYRILCLLSYGAFRLEIPALVLKSEYLLQPLERTESFALRIQDGVKAKVSDDTCSRIPYLAYRGIFASAAGRITLLLLLFFCCFHLFIFKTE